MDAAEQQEDFASLSSFGDDDDNSDDEVQSYDSHDNERLVLASMSCTFSELCHVIQQIDFAAAGRGSAVSSSGNKRKITTDDTTPPSNNPNDKKTLPPELSCHVATFLTVPRIDPTQEVVAATASSQDDTFKLTGVLINDEDSWWLSGAGSMPRGHGTEFVEFHFCRGNTDASAGGGGTAANNNPAQTPSQTQDRHLLLRRLVAVHVRIPPLPLGPLSVREFRIDVATEQQPPNALQPQLLPHHQEPPLPLPPNLVWTTLPGVHVVDNRTGMQRFPIHTPVDAYGVRIVCLSNQISAFLETTDTPHRMERVGFYAVQLE